MKWLKLNSVVEMYNKPVYKKNHPVMALATTKKKIKGICQGIVREIIKRKGDVGIAGFLDRSKLFHVESSDGFNWKKGKELKIKGIEKVINEIKTDAMDFIGLEDPDIYSENKITHIYFTIAFKLSNHPGYSVFLGHAQGKNLNDLTATDPVLSPHYSKNKVIKRGFKEVAISPVKTKGYRINLCESGLGIGGTDIVAVKSKNFSKNWQFLKVAADPMKMKYHWCNGDLSPAFILPKKLISHKNFLVTLINGRSASKIHKGQEIYGQFSVGLALFNPRTGEIPWISPEPIISDPQAKTITFASDFIQTDKESGILYAHVDDSFIRAYRINLKELQRLLPINI